MCVYSALQCTGVLFGVDSHPAPKIDFRAIVTLTGMKQLLKMNKWMNKASYYNIIFPFQLPLKKDKLPP